MLSKNIVYSTFSICEVTLPVPASVASYLMLSSKLAIVLLTLPFIEVINKSTGFKRELSYSETFPVSLSYAYNLNVMIDESKTITELGLAVAFKNSQILEVLDGTSLE